MKPNRFSNLAMGLIKGVRNLFSLYFYGNIFNSFKSIRKLITHGSFLIVTEKKIKGLEEPVKIFSRFQADGDIWNVMSTKDITEAELEKLCNLHQKNMRQKLESIWFLPKFIVSVLVTAITILILQVDFSKVFALFKDFMGA